MYIVNQKNFNTYEKAKYYAKKNKFSFVYNTETSKTTDIRKKVYIIYLYNQKINDIQYVQEFTEPKNILQFLNINKSRLFDAIVNNVDQLTKSKLINKNNKKYCIITDFIN